MATGHDKPGVQRTLTKRQVTNPVQGYGGKSQQRGQVCRPKPAGTASGSQYNRPEDEDQDP